MSSISRPTRSMSDVRRSGSSKSIDTKLESPSPPRKVKDADIEAEFVELLVGMGIAPASRDKMVADLSLKQKWHYLEQHKAKLKDMSKVQPRRQSRRAFL